MSSSSVILLVPHSDSTLLLQSSTLWDPQYLLRLADLPSTFVSGYDSLSHDQQSLNIKGVTLIGYIEEGIALLKASTRKPGSNTFSRSSEHLIIALR